MKLSCPRGLRWRREAGLVFLATLVAFFIVEMGDKTQFATALLAARFHDIALVTLSTTLGMMLANVVRERHLGRCGNSARSPQCEDGTAEVAHSRLARALDSKD